MQFFYLGNGGVSQNVIWGGGLLNPQWLELSQLCHPLHCLRHIPALVGIHHLQGERGTLYREVCLVLTCDGALALREEMLPLSAPDG